MAAFREGPFEVHCSAKNQAIFRAIQRKASRKGLGEAVLSAIKRIWQRLTDDPIEFGEPMYTLPALHLDVRHGAIAPLMVYYGGHQQLPFVVIKGVVALPSRDAL